MKLTKGSGIAILALACIVVVIALSPLMAGGPTTFQVVSPSDSEEVFGQMSIRLTYESATIDYELIQIDGVVVANLTEETEFLVDTATLSDGPHMLNVTVATGGGVAYQEMSIVVRNDNGTEFQIDSPSEGDQVNGKIEVSGVVTAGKLAFAVIDVDGKEVANVTDLNGWSFDTTTISDGEHTMNVTAHDVNGLVTKRTVTFTVGNTEAMIIQEEKLTIVAVALIVVLAAGITLLLIREDLAAKWKGRGKSKAP